MIKTWDNSCLFEHLRRFTRGHTDLELQILNDDKLRKKLKDIVNKLNINKGMGVIIRTAGESMGLKEIKRDYSSLIKLWKEITSKTLFIIKNYINYLIIWK